MGRSGAPQPQELLESEQRLIKTIEASIAEDRLIVEGVMQATPSWVERTETIH